MNGLSLLIESGQNLPFLGYYEDPQAYCIVKYKEQRHVTPISKVGKNPFWMFQTQLNLDIEQTLAPIELYVYNSNSNAEDELLGWIHISPDQLNFITLTKTRFQLINAQGNRIHSFISISSQCLPQILTDHFTQKQSIKIQILNHVQIQQSDFSTINLENILVKFIYDDHMTGLKYGEQNHVIVPYKGIDQLLIALEGIENVKDQSKLIQSFNIKNLKEKQPQYFKLRYFDPVFPQINYLVSLIFTVIPNSNLPSNFSWVQLTLGTDIKENFIVRFYSSLESTIITAAGIPKMLKLGNSQATITFQYFDCQRLEEKQLSKENDQEKIIKTLAKYKPQQIRIIKVNELQWTSMQRSEIIWPIKRQKLTRKINIEFQAFRQPKTIIKQIYPTNFTASYHEKTVKMTHIKISSCYVYEVLPQDSQLCLYHVDFYGMVWHIGSFQLKPNQSEYIIESRMCIRNEGGWLVAICHEMKLKDQEVLEGQENKEDKKRQQCIMTSQQFLNNHMIFKVKTQKDSQLMSGKLIYNRFFTAFAKKVSLTKLCKKFEQAVHNNAMIIQPKYQIWTPFRQGLLEIINYQYSGFDSFNSVELTTGSDCKVQEGFGNDYLCEKTKFFFIKDNRIKLKMITGKNQLTAHYTFGEIFGFPDNTVNEVKTYCRQIQLKGGKLKIWYKFTPLDERVETQKPISLLGQENLNRFSILTSVKIGLKQFKLLKRTEKLSINIKKQEELKMKVRMTQKNCHYESVTQRSATGTFCFFPQSDFLETNGSKSEQGRYVFLSLQLSTVKGEQKDQNIDINNEDTEKQQIFYNAAIDLQKVLGKGLYEVKFYNNKSGRLEVIGEVQIMTENMMRKEMLSFISQSNPSVYVKFQSIALKNLLSYLKNCDSYNRSHLKNLYSYFVIVFVNGFYYSLSSLDSSSKNCEKSLLSLKQTFENDTVLIDNKCIVEIRIGSTIRKSQGREKEIHEKLLELNTRQSSLSDELVNSELEKLQIQIIGQGLVNFSDLVLKQQSKQVSYIEIKLPFLGNRQLYTRYSIEHIALLRQSTQFSIKCNIVKNDSGREEEKGMESKYKNVDVSVLQNCIGLVRIKSIIPKKTALMTQIFNGELDIEVNSEKIQYRAVHNLYTSWHVILIERSQLQFSLARKNNPQKIRIKITLPSYLKTGQILTNSVQLGQFTLCFSLQSFSNTLTTFNKGTLTLKDISFINTKVDKLKLYLPIQQSPNEGVVYTLYEKSIANNISLLNQSIDVQRKMRQLLKTYIMVEILTENTKKKLFAKIYLSQISLSSQFGGDSSESPKFMFVDQIFANSNQGPVKISFSGEYSLNSMDQTKQKVSTLKYTVLGKEREVQVPSNVLNLTNQPNFTSNQSTPSRQNGVKLQLQLPQKFMQYLEENNLQTLLNQTTILGGLKGEKFILLRSKERFNVYYKYLNKLIDVKGIDFGVNSNNSNKKNISKRLKVQMLSINQVNNSTRPVNQFIVNENPEYILTVIQSSYQIPKAVKPSQQPGQKQPQRQSFIVQIQIHKLLSQPLFEKLLPTLSSARYLPSTQKLIEQKKSQQSKTPDGKSTTKQPLQINQKRLLSLKTSPNDQILTKKYCLYLKHGRQEQIVYGVDLEGNLSDKNQSLNIIRFGYDAEDDEIDIFLCVQHFWNRDLTKNLSSQSTNFMIQNYSYDQIQKQWISIMPLCHYLIKVSDIKKNNILFASVMKPFKYSIAQTSLSKELHKRFNLRDVALFGALSFSQGNWGSLTIRVSKLGPVKLKPEIIGFNVSSTTSKVLCFMRISIEHKKTIIKEINTEAKQWINDGYLSFKTFLSHLFMQNRNLEEIKLLKFEMFSISDHSLTKKIFQKRYPLEDVLSQQMKSEKVNIKITESDSNQMADFMQMELTLENTKNLQKPSAFSSSLDTFNYHNLIKVSTQNVSLVDMISYKDKSFIDVLKMILSTNDRTHFQGYINEVKESFIYEQITFDQESSPFGILVIFLPYLMTNANFCYVDVLEMLQMALVKNPGVVKYLDELPAYGNITFLYEIISSIIEKDNQVQLLKNQVPYNYEEMKKQVIGKLKEVPKKQQKISLLEYFTRDNMNSLTHCIKIHSNRLISNKIIAQNYVSQSISLLMLSIVEQILQYSDKFTILIVSNIRKWIEFASFKSMPILMKTIQIFDKLITVKKQNIDLEILEEFLRVIITREVDIDVVYQYWARQKDHSKSQLFDQILLKYYLPKKQQLKINPSSINSPSLDPEVKKTKILKLFYNEYKRLLKRQSRQNSQQNSQQNSRQNSQQNSRINQEGDKISQKTHRIKITIHPQLIFIYKQLFESTLHSDNVILLNAISELIFLWKDYGALDEETMAFFVGLSKKYLEKDKKKGFNKTGTLSTLNAYNNMNLDNESSLKSREQNSAVALTQKNKKIILENVLKHLTGKDKGSLKPKTKKEGQKDSEGFSKYSKYLITR